MYVIINKNCDLVSKCANQEAKAYLKKQMTNDKYVM